MEARARHFVTDLIKNTQTHEEWLAVVRFGLGTLLQNQPLLIECIATEAERIAERAPTVTPTNHVVGILRDLGLQLSLSTQRLR